MRLSVARYQSKHHSPVAHRRNICAGIAGGPANLDTDCTLSARMPAFHTFAQAQFPNGSYICRVNLWHRFTGCACEEI